MMKTKKILAAALAAVMACGVMAGCSGGETASSGSSEAKDTLILGCDTSFAPMAFEENGEVVGFDIDLAKAVVEDKMGKTLEVQPINWDSKEAELDTGKIDIVWNGLTITDERKENMCMSEPYLENKQVIVTLKEGGVPNKDGLAGKRVAMQKESTAVDAFAETGIEAQTTELKDNVACLDELIQGRQDAVVMDSVVAEYYLAKQKDKYGSLQILDDVLADEEYGIAVKKGNDDLMQQIEDALDACIEDGTAAEISTEWFGADKIVKN